MARFDKGRYEQWARAALAQFPVEPRDLCYLGHSDNLTFRVEASDGAASLLRLHHPVTSYYRGIRQSIDAVTAELVWLHALSQEGGLSVQRPIASHAGQWVVEIEIRAGQAVPATLLTWLPGQHFSPAAANAPALAKRFGRLVAKLHNFSSRWVPPEGFSRPRYDLRHFQRMFARLLRGADSGGITEVDYLTLRSASQAISSVIEDLPQDADHWGLVHADLHVGNFLVSSGRIVPIDFSLCGFGHYLFDLSVCITGGLKTELRQSFLEGYRSLRSLTDDELHAVEAYALAGRMSYYAYQIDNPMERAWLQRRLPLVVQNECRRFLDGESILNQL